jgi:uncharacterized membrane protein YciS (DUF1049 family)
MLRIISIILFLIILLVGVEFSAVNSEPVTVNYVLGTAVLPLSLVVVCAFSLGLLVAAVISLAIILPLRWRLVRLQHTVSSQEQEIGALQRRSDQDIRRV